MRRSLLQAKPKAPKPMKRILTALVLSAMTCGLVTGQDNTPVPDYPDTPPPPPATEPADTVPVPEPAPPPPEVDPAVPPGVEPSPVPPVHPTNVVSTNLVFATNVVSTNFVQGTNVSVQGTNFGAAATNVVPVTPDVPSVDPTVEPTEPTTETPATTPLGAANPASEVIPLIQIEDVPLTDAIRNLARQANLNFQFDPRVTASNQPNVSIRFENVTAAEALQAVLDNYDLVLVRDPRSKIARVTVKDPKAEDPLVSKIVQLRYSDPTNMVAMIKPNLSARSQVIADSRTSQLIVTTTEREMTAVEELVTRLDLPTKQVLIEANIYETARTPSTIKGIDWSGTLEGQNIEFGNNTPDIQSAKPGTPPIPPPPGSPPGTVGTPGTPDQPAVFGRNFAGAPRVAVNTANGFYPPIGFLNADGVKVILSFLNKDADTEVIATPRAVTLDNQPAVLSVTRAFPIFLITPGSANTPGGSQINYTNLGTILHVTPRITADDQIALKVVPEVSNIDSVDRKVIQNTVNEANIYAIRRIETHVMIPSGNTLVMGGLINDTETKSYTKVPILGDVPVLGWAFRREGKTRNKSNLLIFVTPTIVSDDAFHASASGNEFLQTKPVGKVESPESPWDSGKPHDWTRD